MPTDDTDALLIGFLQTMIEVVETVERDRLFIRSVLFAETLT